MLGCIIVGMWTIAMPAEDDTLNDDEFSQYALSTMRSIMGDTDITQWEDPLTHWTKLPWAATKQDE